MKAGGADIIWPGASLADGSGTVGFNAEAWSEQVVTIPTGATTLQAGVTWNTVTAGQIFYVNEIEITKISTGTPEYQYTLKDHLGNTRLTFTSNPATDQNTATLEDANLNVEQSKFLRITNAKRVNAAIFDRTNGASTGYSERLNGSTNEKYGVARSISVVPGDVINAEVYGKYVDQNSSNWNGPLTTLMGQIAANQAGVVYDGANYSSSTSSFPFAGLINTTGSTGGPKAYINWLIFDRNYTFLNGGYVRMSATPKEQGQDVAHELMSSGNITINEPGYVYIYLSNEETSPVEVYFDDFKVTQTNSPVVQTEDYYPFGLAFNEYQRENGITNPFQYNGKEMQDELNLGWLDYGARMYMAEIGRWGAVDPLASKMMDNSPYQYVGNNPIGYIDLFGMTPIPDEVLATLSNQPLGTKETREPTISEGAMENARGFKLERKGCSTCPKPGQSEQSGEKPPADPGKGTSYNRSGAPGLLLGWAHLLGVDTDTDFFYGFVNPEAAGTPSNESSGIGDAANGVEAGALIGKSAAQLAGDANAAELLGSTGRLASGMSLATDVKKAVKSGSPTLGDVTKIAVEGFLSFGPKAVSKITAPLAIVDLGVGLVTGTSLGGRVAAGIDYSRTKK